MDEKTMVNDILSGVKSGLTSYQTAISECENMRTKTSPTTNQKQRRKFPIRIIQSSTKQRILCTCS